MGGSIGGEGLLNAFLDGDLGLGTGHFDLGAVVSHSLGHSPEGVIVVERYHIRLSGDIDFALSDPGVAFFDRFDGKCGLLKGQIH